MSKSRQTKIRHYIKAGRYFEALERTLEIVMRAVEAPTRKREAEKLLTRLRGDMGFFQEYYAIVKKKALRQNRSQPE